MIAKHQLQATRLDWARYEASALGRRYGREYLVVSSAVRRIAGRFVAFVAYFVPTGRETAGY